MSKCTCYLISCPESQSRTADQQIISSARWLLDAVSSAKCVFLKGCSHAVSKHSVGRHGTGAANLKQKGGGTKQDQKSIPHNSTKKHKTLPQFEQQIIVQIHPNDIKYSNMYWVIPRPKTLRCHKTTPIAPHTKNDGSGRNLLSRRTKGVCKPAFREAPLPVLWDHPRPVQRKQQDANWAHPRKTSV